MIRQIINLSVMLFVLIYSVDASSMNLARRISSTKGRSLYKPSSKKPSPKRTIKRNMLSNTTTTFRGDLSNKSHTDLSHARHVDFSENKFDDPRTQLQYAIDRFGISEVRDLLAQHEHKAGQLSHAQFDFYFRWQFHTSKQLSDLLLTGDNQQLLVWCLETYQEFLRECQEQSHEADAGQVEMKAKRKLSRLLQNAIATATSIVAPLADPEFQESTILSKNADALADLSLIERNVDEYVDIHAAQKLSRKLAHRLTIKVAHLVSALILHNDVKLFAEFPGQAYLYLTENFSGGSRPVLATPHSHMIANYLVAQAIARLLTE